MITLAGTDVVPLLIAGARIQTCRSDLPVRLSCFGAVPLGGLLGGCAWWSLRHGAESVVMRTLAAAGALVRRWSAPDARAVRGG